MDIHRIMPMSIITPSVMTTKLARLQPSTSPMGVRGRGNTSWISLSAIGSFTVAPRPGNSFRARTNVQFGIDAGDVVFDRAFADV